MCFHLLLRGMFRELVGPLALKNATTYQSGLDRQEAMCENENLSGLLLYKITLQCSSIQMVGYRQVGLAYPGLVN
jgi:hypothetical protein